MEKIKIVGSPYGFFEEPLEAELDIESLSGGSEEEPWPSQGWAYVTEQGPPYLGSTAVHNQPIFGPCQKYRKIWQVYLTADGWFGQPIAGVSGLRSLND